MLGLFSSSNRFDCNAKLAMADVLFVVFVTLFAANFVQNKIRLGASW